MRLLGRLLRLVVLGVAVAALREQLGRPPEERTWFGRIGPVPYDFRLPTVEQLRASYWNPDSEQLFSDRPLGVGWAINFAQVVKIVQELRQQANQMNA